MAIQVGDKAPAFTLKNAAMEDVRLEDFSGQTVLLLFVPLAFTGVCTEEVCQMSAEVNDYAGLGARVMAISVDSPFSLKAWADKEGIAIPLLSDFNKEVSAAYGAQFEDLLGFKGVAKRSAFVVDGRGIVRYAWVSDDPKVLPDFAAIKACLQSLN